MSSCVSENSLQIYFAGSESAVSANLEREYLAMMPPGIRLSILGYKRWQDRQATLFGKLLLLRALQIEFHDAWVEKFQSLEITRDGKPFIKGWTDFNISHSEGMVALAVIQSGAVGIDIEKIRAVNIDDYSHIVPEVANLQERYDIGQVNNIFFNYWTQKEAVLKGYGKGLFVPPEHVLIKENEDMAFLYNTKWHTKKLLLGKDYCCCAATDHVPEHVAVERVNLMNGIP